MVAHGYSTVAPGRPKPQNPHGPALPHFRDTPHRWLRSYPMAATFAGIFPGVRLSHAGTRDSHIKGFKTIAMEDVVYQPKAASPRPRAAVKT